MLISHFEVEYANISFRSWLLWLINQNFPRLEGHWIDGPSMPVGRMSIRSICESRNIFCSHKKSISYVNSGSMLTCWCQAKRNFFLAKELKIINIAIDCPVLMMKLPVLLPKTCHHLIEHGVSNDPTFLPKVEKMIVHQPYELAFQSVSRQLHWLTTFSCFNLPHPPLQVF